ncbi:hypothetical protein FORMB_25410 [Formosa sp. Hel1_33_131]|uniref:hypothetical protein n=1 Tax=Formosa sp. Hel1_33_131 TaxID=1336794 RepID=UPI00084E1488|nr:hypothetical protein [Formosa sp. Hel1_33_131]AOR29558.1 hypothetical protein FORMB_25410 [Formosa sp. Hel1_33_131]
MQRDTTIRLYEAVREEHQRLCNVKSFGVQKYSNAYIKAALAKKFYKTTKTIEDILFYKYEKRAS